MSFIMHTVWDKEMDNFMVHSFRHKNLSPKQCPICGHKITSYSEIWKNEDILTGYWCWGIHAFTNLNRKFNAKEREMMVK